MANRNTLSVNQVEKFKAYLVAEGWELQEPKGDYEVLRATKEGRKHTLIAYSRLATNGGKQIQHLTLADRDMPIVRAFLKKKYTEEMKKIKIGEWVYGKFDIPHCSECGYEPTEISPFCPMCNANMESEDTE